MKLTKFLILIIITINYSLTSAQILHSESFAVILDTTKTIKGSVLPDFKLQNLRKNLLEFENTTDITFKIKNNAITIANKIELAKYGKDVLLSGGFLFFKYRKILESKFVFETYSQMHWSESRGLKFKYAGGVNLRYRIYVTDKMGFFGGIGPFYEYEKWNYDGVSDILTPLNPKDVTQENIKLGSYLSFKWKTNVNLVFDMSVYHQSKFNQIFSTPRLASSTSVKYNFTEHLGLIFQYQNIYDYNPVVPIDKLYNVLSSSIEVSF